MRVDTPEFNSPNTSLNKEPRFVVGILYDADSIYVCSHDDITDVPGTVLVNALAEPIVNSQKINPDTATAEIGDASFSLVDLESAFTQEVRDRLADGEGLRGRRCKFFLGYAGLPFTSFQLLGTQDVSSVSMRDLAYSVKCNDILRTLKEKIFVMKSTTLAATFTAGDTTMDVANTDGFEMVDHGPSYTDAPSATVGYFKIKNTTYRYTGKTADSFTGLTAVFGTEAETITVDGGTAQDRREKITEVMYLELPAVKLLYAILTGDLYGDGATLPDGWHLGIDPDYIRLDDFLNIGTEMWDVSDDSKGFIVRFRGLANENGKTFCETELCLLLGMYQPVYSDGSLGLRRMVRVTGNSATVLTLDETNSVQVGALEHDFDSVHNIFAVNWDWNGTRFLRTTAFADLNSRSVHKDASLYDLNFKGLYGAKHTDGLILQILDQIRDRYAAPPLLLDVELLHSLNRLEIGDIVRVQYRHVRDFTGPEPDVDGPAIDRAFEVQQVTVNHRTGRVSVKLFGSSADPTISPPTEADTSLPDTFYTSEGTELATAPGITIVGNVLTVASTPLAGHADLNNPAAIYYHDDDLTIDNGVTLLIEDNIQLRVKGFFQNNGDIDGVGRGLPGVDDDHSAMSVPGDDDAKKGAIPHLTISGTAGYLGNSRGSDGLLKYEWINAFDFYNTYTVPLTRGRFSVAPRLQLKVTGDTLTGLPTDIRGTSGGPGGRLHHDIHGVSTTVHAYGTAGANGGAGLAVICRGFAFGASGGIDLSGDDPAVPAVQAVDSKFCYAGIGGPGCPGAFYLLLDGASFSQPDLSNFVARVGNAPIPGYPLPATFAVGNGQSNQNTSVIATEPASGYLWPEFRHNYAVDAYVIQPIPEEQDAVESEDSRPPPPSSIIVTGVELANIIDLTLPSFATFDTVQIYAASTNDRSGATLIYEGRATQYRHQLPGSAQRFYWARDVDDTEDGRRVYSEWLPESPTGGFDSTSLVGGAGPAGASLSVEYSINGSSSWHSTFTTGDIYMRQQIGSGGWSAAMRIVGEQGVAGSTGAAGNFIDFVFKRAASLPATPTGNTPAGWFDAPPSTDGNPLWSSSAEKTAANVVIGTWSAPQIFATDGANGANGATGATGAQGPGLFDWTGSANVTLTPSTITKSGGGASWNASAYSLQSYTGGCFVTARAKTNNTYAMLALNIDPATDSDYTSMDFSWYIHGDGNVYIYQGATFIAGYGTYTTATVLSIVHDNDTVQFFKDGVLQLSVSGQEGKRFFLDTSILDVGAGFVDVHFGPAGSKGVAAKTIRLTSNGQAFTYNAAGVASPSSQSIVFTASRQNIATASSFSTSPVVTLTGTGDTRTLTDANFGANTSVEVTVSSEGYSDKITVYKLQQGATGATGSNGSNGSNGTNGSNGVSAVTGFLTNESHTLAADKDGVVLDFSGAAGLFKMFDGITDVTASATFSVIAQTNCTATVNTATNTPVSGQPRGYYRVTAMTQDNASVTINAAYGSFGVDKVFSISRSRAGIPGNGSNLLDVSSWSVGTAGSQGNFASISAPESSVVLGGNGVHPLGPFGTSEPLFLCDTTGDGGADGGWENYLDLAGKIDSKKSYRSTIWFYVNQLSGYFYHGCDGSATTNVGGGANGNPYFISLGLPGSPLQAGKWYLSVGIIHGDGYGGVNSGISGIYSASDGRKLVDGTDYRMLPGATQQMHRVYHYYDASSTTLQYMSRPIFEELNGNESSLDELMGRLQFSPWLLRGGCVVSDSTIYKVSGSNNWGDADASSVAGYQTCHVRFKPNNTTTHFMVGLSESPQASMSFSNLDHAWYCGAGPLLIYQDGAPVGTTYGTYTANTVLDIIYDGTNVVYKKDGVTILTTADAGKTFHMDSAFYSIGAGCNSLLFGPGTDLPAVDTIQLAPGATFAVLQVDQAGPNNYYVNNGQFLASASIGPYPFDCNVELTATLEASCTGANAYTEITYYDGVFALPGIRQIVRKTSEIIAYSMSYEFALPAGQTSQAWVTGHGPDVFPSRPLILQNGHMKIKVNKRA